MSDLELQLTDRNPYILYEITRWLHPRDCRQLATTSKQIRNKMLSERRIVIKMFYFPFRRTFSYYLDNMTSFHVLTTFGLTFYMFNKIQNTARLADFLQSRITSLTKVQQMEELEKSLARTMSKNKERRCIRRESTTFKKFEKILNKTINKLDKVHNLIPDFGKFEEGSREFRISNIFRYTDCQGLLREIRAKCLTNIQFRNEHFFERSQPRHPRMRTYYTIYFKFYLHQLFVDINNILDEIIENI